MTDFFVIVNTSTTTVGAGTVNTVIKITSVITVTTSISLVE